MRNPKDYAAKRLSTIEPSPSQSDPTSKPGPNTPEGKHRSSQNATRHGLAGRIVVLATEDMSQFHKFSAELVESLHPQTPLERELAQIIADGYWRLRRVRTTEDSLYALGHDEGQGEFDADHEIIHAAYTAARTFRDHSKAFANLSIYEHRIQRGIDRNMQQLEALQAGREATRRAAMQEAIRLRDLHKMQNIPWNPTDDGFVYSTPEIDVEAHRRERRRLALEAEKVGFNLIEFKKRNEKLAA